MTTPWPDPDESGLHSFEDRFFGGARAETVARQQGPDGQVGELSFRVGARSRALGEHNSLDVLTDDRIAGGDQHTALWIGFALQHIEAPWLLDGPINGERFRIYVEWVLVPTLKPGEIVIMDNLGSHKGKAIRQAIRAAKARLFFLLKYSSDPNPIEQFFSKLKHSLRKASARTPDEISTAIGAILETFTAKECRNYFKNAGYE